jgi:ATP-binding cassette subfamily B protein
VVPFWVMRNERLIHERFKKVQESFAHLSAMAQEGLNGIRVVKAYAREDEQVRRFREAGEEFIDLSLSLSRVQSVFGPSLDFVMSVGLVLLLALGGMQTIEGALTLGTFVAFQKYIQKLIWPMTALGMGISIYQRAVASSQRYEEVVASEPDVQSRQGSYSFPQGPWKTGGKIEFDQLSFRYSEEHPWILKNISLVIEPGARVAFLGAVGSGKSTLLSLIPRLYPVPEKMIKVDGIDINHWDLGSLRQQMGYVSQDVFLFSDTVAENVSFGVSSWLKEENAFTRLENSAKAAQVYDEVLKLPQGWGTLLGERGANLSGGQRQRLTIARALARDPRILILDDALAAVDTQTESAILKALKERATPGTELVAAHRVSTVLDADWIVVMAEGRVVQQGKHHSLVKESDGLYAQFYRQQRLMQDLENYVAHF